MCEPLGSPKGYAPVISSYARFDRASKWIPVLSTITSLWDIACKLYMACWKNPIDPDNHYWSYIHDKSYLRCIALLFPFIGNIAIFIYDLIARCKTVAVMEEIISIKHWLRTYYGLKDANINVKKDETFLRLSQKKQNDILAVFTQLDTFVGKKELTNAEVLSIILNQIKAEERLLPLASRTEPEALEWLGINAEGNGQTDDARDYYRQAAQEGDPHAIKHINRLNSRLCP
jgi:hypothetical protein